MNLIILKAFCSSSQHYITFMSQLYYKHRKTSEKVLYSEDHLHILIWQKLLSKSQCFTTSIFYFSFSVFLTVGNGYKLQFTLVVSSKIIQTAWQIKGNNEKLLQSSESYNVLSTGNEQDSFWGDPDKWRSECHAAMMGFDMGCQGSTEEYGVIKWWEEGNCLKTSRVCGWEEKH